MRRLLFPLVLVLLATAAFAQNWTPLRGETNCIGGDGCRDKKLRIPLEDRPVVGVRFTAHDNIGTKAEGALRVKIDGNTIRGYMDIPRRGETFTIDVDELRGRYLIFEPANDDEVEITDIAVQYGRDRGGRIPRDRGEPDDTRGGREGWRAYPNASGCIGGTECGKNGKRITIALADAPVLGVRFFAHDAIGERADGKLSVRIDDTTVGFYIDVQRNGKRHELDVDHIVGSKLVIETASNDEVDVKDIEVLYGRGGGGGYRGGGWGRGPREITDEGACIGGSECGGRRARIRINLDGRPVESLRFYARDDVGTRAGGELRIRIDDEILEYALDIPRDGRTFTIDAKNIAGDYLYIEPAEDDEVVVKDIRVRFRQSSND
ncbi:MAG TPA: hypothetical protein VJZ00_17200 [Thermoanaerobaculia bacterium]|nr:hypothetical protein [Thermoanaerobaculia bacterium]